MDEQLASPDPSFEAAMGRLQEIVHAMEDGAQPLQQLLALFEEGTQLGQRCQELLDLAELRIQQVLRAADGSVQLSRFDGAAAVDGAPAF